MYIKTALIYSFIILLLICGLVYSRLDLLLLLLLFLVGYPAARLARRDDLPERFFNRFWPITAPVLFLLLASVPYTVIRLESYNSLGYSFFFLFIGVIFTSYWLFFIAKSEYRQRSRERLKGIILILALFAVCVTAAWGARSWVVNQILARNQILIGPGSSETVVSHEGTDRYGHGINKFRYLPFQPSSLLVSPTEKPSLRVVENWPRLDGSIALLPIYGAAAQAVYEGLNVHTVRAYVDCNNTARGFDRLLEGQVDLYFGPKVSPSQKSLAESKGLTLTEVTVAKEAFVFLVHRDNPVKSLTLEQIQKIYSRQITNWLELGGPNQAILAFQRPDNSGSQMIMKMAVMQNLPLAQPLKEEYVGGMGELVQNVAAYRNRKNALGYSFRWYATVQYPSPDIKLLSIGGVTPTEENIRNGTYPLVSDVVAVHARPLSLESRNLLDWLTGREGQALIQKIGYVPILVE